MNERLQPPHTVVRARTPPISHKARPRGQQSRRRRLAQRLVSRARADPSRTGRAHGPTLRPLCRTARAFGLQLPRRGIAARRTDSRGRQGRTERDGADRPQQPRRSSAVRPGGPRTRSPHGVRRGTVTRIAGKDTRPDRPRGSPPAGARRRSRRLPAALSGDHPGEYARRKEQAGVRTRRARRS